jgi:excisionase family DNA binding protein
VQTEPKLYPFEKACRERLGIGKSKGYAMVQQGLLKTVKIGKKTLISEAELSRFIASLDT